MAEFFLVIHIVAAAAWIGATIAQIATTRRVIAQGGAAAASWMDTVVYWGRAIYTPAAIVILATGIGLVLDSALYEFSNAFVSIGFFVVIVGAALGMAVFAKGGKRSAAAFAAGDDDSGRAEAMRLMPWTILDSSLLLVAVIAMVNRWGV